MRTKIIEQNKDKMCKETRRTPRASASTHTSRASRDSKATNAMPLPDKTRARDREIERCGGDRWAGETVRTGEYKGKGADETHGRGTRETDEGTGWPEEQTGDA
jgi:hypothetical protein